jgi:hypothetical protein
MQCDYIYLAGDTSARDRLKIMTGLSILGDPNAGRIMIETGANSGGTKIRSVGGGFRIAITTKFGGRSVA